MRKDPAIPESRNFSSWDNPTSHFTSTVEPIYSPTTMVMMSMYNKKRFRSFGDATQPEFSVSATSILKPQGSGKKHLFEVLLVYSSSDFTLIPSLEAVEQLFHDCAIRYRLTKVALNKQEVYQDGRDSFDETITKLQGLIESSRVRGFKMYRQWAKSRPSSPPHLIILTDTLGSILVRGVALKCSSGIPTNTELMLFFQENEVPDSSQFVDGKYRQEIVESVERIITEFDSMILKQKSPYLNSIVWTTTRQRRSIGTEFGNTGFWRLLRTPLEEAVDRVDPMLRRFQNSTGFPNFKTSTTFEVMPAPLTDTSFTQAKRYQDLLVESRRSAEPIPPLDSVLSAFNDSQYKISYSSAEPPVIKIPHLRPSTPEPGMQSSSVRDSSDNNIWEDLRDQAEARLQSGDNRYALAMFQDCLTMAIPYDTAIWEIKSSLAFARMMLGQYVRAEGDLRQLRQELSRYVAYSPKPTITNIRGTVLLNHALTLFRLGRYHEMDRCLQEIVLPNEFETPPKNPSREQQRYYTLSATVCRLRALSVAQQGYFISQTINAELKSADRWCEKLGDIESSEPVRISNVLNRCRISALRGHYADALSMLQPALITAIAEVGETNLLTMEGALLCSFLQIETGYLRQGRMTCERCADVIEETLGNDHPLALEAEHILISASHQEGLLLNALDDAVSLCRRAESSTDLGYKHPAALRYRAQLGGLYIECGLYSSAESVLAIVQQDTRHPEILRIRSQLALAQYHLGKLDISEKTIFTALYGQLFLYLRFNEDKLWPKNDTCKSIRQFLKDSPLLHGVEQAFKAAHPESTTHPDILHSLLTCAKVLAREPRADLELALRILRLVRDSGASKFGQVHSLPLLASLTMGEVLSKMAMKESDDVTRQKLYNKAISSLGFVTQPKPVPLHSAISFVEEPDPHDITVLLDSDHPLLLSARQEHILLSLLFSEPEATMEHVLDGKNELNAILTAQRNRPGPSHRQTIKTLISVLSIELSFSEPSSDVIGIYKEIVEPLASDHAEQQRFLECLLLRERVAGIVRSRPDLFGDEYRSLLGDIERQISEGEVVGDSSIRGAIERVKERVDIMMRGI